MAAATWPSSAEVRAYLDSKNTNSLVEAIILLIPAFESADGRTGDSGSSFGPWQMHYGGISRADWGNGLGDSFTTSTGLDAADPNTWRDQVDYISGIIQGMAHNPTAIGNTWHALRAADNPAGFQALLAVIAGGQPPSWAGGATGGRGGGGVIDPPVIHDPGTGGGQLPDPVPCTHPGGPLSLLGGSLTGGINSGNLGEYAAYWGCQASAWVSRVGWIVGSVILVGLGILIYTLDKKAPGVEGIKVVTSAAPRAIKKAAPVPSEVGE